MRINLSSIILLMIAAPAGADNLLLPLAHSQWDESAARHLMRRAAFEGRPAEIARLAAMSPKDAVATLVDFDTTVSAQRFDPPLLDPLLSQRIDRRRLKELDASNRQLYDQTRRQAERFQLARMQAWWLERMVRSPHQLEEKMTLFWHGHFTSGFREVRSSYLLYQQNQLLREYALGNYYQLLLKISTDPAMLIYLDSARNRKEQPNENYARELMELFTLGEGQYTEADIKAAARAFTGWTIDGREFKFRRRQHDYDDKTFMGRTGPWNGGDIIQIILEQPEAQYYIVTRLWEFFCYDDPERPVVRGLAATLRKNDFAIKPVVRQILMSRGFYSAKSRGRRIKSPVQLTVGTVRTLGITEYDALAMNKALGEMGQLLFQPPNVKGWDGGHKWINTATLFKRYNFVGAVVNGYRGQNYKRAMRRMEAGVEAFGFLELEPPERVGQKPFDPQPLLAGAQVATPRKAVELFAERLLAVPLADERLEELAGLLIDEHGNYGATSHEQQVRLRVVIHLLMSTPEYQLY
jgi:uncharacterized protein (DUF1800 family)